MKKKAILIVLFVLFPLVVSLACTCGVLPFAENIKEKAEELLNKSDPAVVEQEPAGKSQSLKSPNLRKSKK